MSNVKRDGRYVIREYGYDVFYRRHVSFPKIWLSLSAVGLCSRGQATHCTAAMVCLVVLLLLLLPA